MKIKLPLLVIVAVFLVALPLSYAQDCLKTSIDINVLGEIHLMDLDVMHCDNLTTRSFGEFTFKAISSSGRVNDFLYFQPSFLILSDPPVKMNDTYITLTTNYDSSLNKIKIFQNETLIFEKNISSLLCNRNSVCEFCSQYSTSCTGYENSLSCPSDCRIDSSDGACNFSVDGYCDPDCSYDEDCTNPQNESKSDSQVVSNKTSSDSSKEPLNVPSTNSSKMLIILIGLSILGLSISFLIYLTKHKKSKLKK